MIIPIKHHLAIEKKSREQLFSKSFYAGVKIIGTKEKRAPLIATIVVMPPGRSVRHPDKIEKRALFFEIVKMQRDHVEEVGKKEAKNQLLHYAVKRMRKLFPQLEIVTERDNGDIFYKQLFYTSYKTEYPNIVAAESLARKYLEEERYQAIVNSIKSEDIETKEMAG